MSIRMVIVLGISLFTTRIVLRVLGVEDYGIFNVVAGFVSMFGFLNTSNGSKNRPLIPSVHHSTMITFNRTKAYKIIENQEGKAFVLASV